MINQVCQLVRYASRTTPFRSDLDRHLIRAAMVFTFFTFSIQKWSQYTVEMLVPLISHSPVVFWLLPAFGVRGAGYFLGTTETIFGCLIFLGYWSPRLGILGALGSTVTFIGTTSIIPFLPDGWASEAGGFPIMTLPVGFLMKDVLFLAASFYLLKQDVIRAALENERPSGRAELHAGGQIRIDAGDVKRSNRAPTISESDHVRSSADRL